MNNLPIQQPQTMMSPFSMKMKKKISIGLQTCCKKLRLPLQLCPQQLRPQFHQATRLSRQRSQRSAPSRQPQRLSLLPRPLHT
jgi:hypothetical protein